MPTPQDFHPDLTPRIEASGLVGRKGKPYHTAPGLIAAVNVALELERPLLLTGEPGCGKTDFAWAAAHALAGALGHGPEELAPLQCYVRSDSRARDLLYTYDAIRRFGDAQNGGQEGLIRASDPRNYIELQALGRALVSPRRRAVLIDEIDKAPRDLPNDLLRELDQTSFEIIEIPEELTAAGSISSHGVPLRRVMARAAGPGGKPLRAPLIIITSNVERQLPDAFLRRCIFWHIKFPDDLLADILADHFPEHADGDLLGRAIAVYMRVRQTKGLTRKPGTAELLDWVAALTRVFRPDYALAQVRRFSDALAGGRAIPWADLPALSCLVKMREDQDTLFGS
jgi:MoxR-like ATPase